MMAENAAGQRTNQLFDEDEGGLDGNTLQKDEANIDESELRTDPEDDKTYTWPEFKAAKLDMFTLEELIEYWFDEMMPDFPEGTKVVVSGLGKAANDEVLAETFGRMGELAFCQVYYDANEESKGFAKLQYTTVEAAEAAVKQLDGTEMGGQRLVVRPLMDRGKNAKIFVGGLDPEATEAFLEKVFSDVGEVAEVSIASDRDTGEPKGTAKVEFIFPHSVDQACRRFHLAKLGGKRVCCLPWLERAISWNGRAVRSLGPSVLVSRLSTETTAESLRQLFERVDGMVVCSARIIIDRDIGISRGIAHVEIGDQALVDTAISKLNGAELDGSSIILQSFDLEGKPPRLPAVICRQLSDSTTAADLRDHFAKFDCNGTKVICDRESGKPSGLGLVEFHDEDSARRAAEELNGSELNGAILRLVPGSKRNLGPSVFVTGLGPDIDEDSLAEFFAEAGEVFSVSIFRDRGTRLSYGKGLVVFKTEDARQKALKELNGRDFNGKPIQLREGVGRGELFPVYVCGLDASTTGNDLHRHFSRCGELVEANIVVDRDTGLSRCFGKVCFRSEEAQRRAIQEYNGSELSGKIIQVRGHSTNYRASNRIPPADEHAVFLQGLSSETTSAKLRAFFADCGEVTWAHVYMDRETGRPRGHAKICLASEASARRALEKAAGAKVDGVTITAREFGKMEVRKIMPTVFVGGLHPSTTEESLRRHFAAAGEVAQAVVMVDRVTLRPKGAARVSFMTEEAQKVAIDTLNLSELDERRISVQEFLWAPRTGSTGGDVCHADVSHQRWDIGMPPHTEDWPAAFVTGLNGNTTSEGLEAHFAVFGSVCDAQIFTDKETGRPRRAGKVCFLNEEDRQRAVEEGDGSVLDGHEVTVKEWLSPNAKEVREKGAACKAPIGMGARAPELRVDPEDGLAYSYEEFVRRHRASKSPDEILDRWRFDCSPAPAGAPRGHRGEECEADEDDDDDGAASEPPALVPAGAATPGLSRATVAPRAPAKVVPAACNAKNVALGMKEWLSEVDKLWLQRMDGVEHIPADRGARSCLGLLKEQFDSLGQIMSIYAERLPSGKLSLKDSFFDDSGITKLGHKRLMKKWISENA